MKLIDVETDLINLLDSIMEAQQAGEVVPDESLTLLHDYTLAATDKRDACAAFVGFVERAEGDCDSEIKRLQARKSSLCNARERFMDYVRDIMETQGVRAIMGTHSKFVLTESVSVDAGDVDKLPTDFLRVVPETVAPDKKAINEALQAGRPVGTARLVTKNNLKVSPLAVKDKAGDTVLGIKP